jgi:hypothetical protein
VKKTSQGFAGESECRNNFRGSKRISKAAVTLLDAFG